MFCHSADPFTHIGRGVSKREWGRRPPRSRSPPSEMSELGDDVKGLHVTTGEWTMEESVMLPSEEESVCVNTVRHDEGNPLERVLHVRASKRPTDEVQDTVDYMLGLGGSKKVKGQVDRLVATLVEDRCPFVELSMFYSYLQALLTTLLSPVASFAENKDLDEESPIAVLVDDSIMKDIIGASKTSLRMYKRASSNGGKFKGFLRRKSTPAAPVGSSLNRRLSCHSPMLHDKTCSDEVVKSFGEAFTIGDDSPTHRGISPTKHRPDSRIDRANSCLNLEIPLPKYSATPPTASLQPTPPAKDHLRRKASMQIDGIKPYEDLFSMKYFDIIIETICVVMCVKYEHQLMELSTHGEACGVRRAAEWITARFLDEFYNDGIDPSQALCEQLVLCAEGLAKEEGEFVWRRCSAVDQNVMGVVWGDPPEDVLAGILETKVNGSVWYEWGMFTQPGVRTPDGRLFTSPRLNPLQYRYRLALPSLSASATLSLRNTHTAPLRAPSFLLTRPGAHLTEPDGGTFVGITLSCPPEGSDHKGSNLSRPRATRKPLPQPVQQDGAYCDIDLYAWSFEESLRQQREQSKNEGYSQLESSRRQRCCCVIS
eukprot:TRINITY_DN3912_c0_g1_i15.p1 TRINITY_DN3912_c0_g1~~TRINITY_DN3912_c0_g1_i15.p1  ORF type:complete len:597 (+),score=90.05 TRINITY_DN3912_c0_g1_i15:469-2259(+)